MKTGLLMLAGVILLLLARAASANPSPGFGDYVGPAYWLIKTLPLNYAADIIALGIALLITAQLPDTSWRFLPLYNLPIVVAGYLADYIGASIAGVTGLIPGAVVTSHDPIIGEMYQGFSGMDYHVAAGEAASMLAWTTLLIFGFNLLIIAGILRINETDSYRRLPIAAAVVAVITTPYLSVNREVAWTRIIPLLMLIAGLAVWVGSRKFLGYRQHSPRGESPRRA